MVAVRRLYTLAGVLAAAAVGCAAVALARRDNLEDAVPYAEGAYFSRNVGLPGFEQLGVTREQLWGELGARGVKLPSAPLPEKPSWGPLAAGIAGGVSTMSAELRRTGVLYRFAYKDDEHVMISVDER